MKLKWKFKRIMAMVDLVLRDGRVVTHMDVVKAEVAIEGEKIAAIGKGLRRAGKRWIRKAPM
jgi:urease alpha subunit